MTATEDALVRYVVREVETGRPLAEVMADPVRHQSRRPARHPAPARPARGHRRRRRRCPGRPALQARAALASVDAAELARLRLAQRRELVLDALRDGGRRLLEDARPGGVAVLYAETSDGVAVVLPVAAGGKLPPRAERLARAAAAALAEAADLPTPARAGDVELEAARWEGQVALRIAHPAPGEVLEILPLTLEDHAQELDRVRLEPCCCPPATSTTPSPPPRSAGSGAPRSPAAWAAARERPRSRPRSRRPSPAWRPSSPRRQRSTRPSRTTRSRAAAPRRRMLRRLDGMGKYGGYHTEFRHLARGFAGHERALALEVGEALLRAGLLAEKPSVGQRHVSLVAARTSGDPRAGRARHLRGAAAQPAGGQWPGDALPRRRRGRAAPGRAPAGGRGSRGALRFSPRPLEPVGDGSGADRSVRARPRPMPPERRWRSPQARRTGRTTTRLGVFPRGHPYSAADPELMLWVHATLVDVSLSAYQRYERTLSPAEQEAYYREMAVVAQIFGTPAAIIPATLASSGTTSTPRSPGRSSESRRRRGRSRR